MTSDRAGAARRRGALRLDVLGWMLAAAAIAALPWLLGDLEQQVVESGYRAIQPNRSRLDTGSTWVDPSWEAELTARLARQAPVDAQDEAARAALLAEIASLSFVAELGPASVIWPDGLRVPLRFRNPIACVFVGDGYLAVADDGVVLTGLNDAPPWVGWGWLPVLGAPGAVHEHLVPGSVLDEVTLADALDIARSMWVHLGAEDWETIGRIRIDASLARFTGPEEPGAILLLEQGREVWFGRAPREGEPGSLPAEEKWASVSRALGYLRSGSRRLDWQQVDVRWDMPGMTPFEVPDADEGEDALEPEAGEPR